MASWRSLFEIPVPYDAITDSIIILLIHIIGFTLLALWRFNKKDINT